METVLEETIRTEDPEAGPETSFVSCRVFGFFLVLKGGLTVIRKLDPKLVSIMWSILR